jgi:phage protein D
VLAPLDPATKYSSFIAPKNQITINQEDIQQKYGLDAASLTVELATGVAEKFNITFNDPQAKWINTSLFELNKKIEIQLGYGSVLEKVISGEVASIKTVFSPSGPPMIEVSGEGKTVGSVSLTPVGLTYGKTLLNFTAILTTDNQTTKTLTPSRTLAQGFSANYLRCVAECIGLPDIKPGVILALANLAGKFSMNYLVEKAVHRWDGSYGFRTSFEAKANPRNVAVFGPNI